MRAYLMTGLAVLTLLTCATGSQAQQSGLQEFQMINRGLQQHNDAIRDQQQYLFDEAQKREQTLRPKPRVTGPDAIGIGRKCPGDMRTC